MNTGEENTIDNGLTKTFSTPSKFEKQLQGMSQDNISPSYMERSASPNAVTQASADIVTNDAVEILSSQAGANAVTKDTMQNLSTQAPSDALSKEVNSGIEENLSSQASINTVSSPVEQNIQPHSSNVYVSLPSPIDDSQRFMFQQQNHGEEAMIKNSVSDTAFQVPNGVSMGRDNLPTNVLSNGVSTQERNYPYGITPLAQETTSFYGQTQQKQQQSYSNHIQSFTTYQNPAQSEVYITNTQRNEMTSPKLSAKSYTDEPDMIQKQAKVPEPSPRLSSENTRNDKLEKQAKIQTTLKETENIKGRGLKKTINNSPIDKHETHTNYATNDNIDQYFKQLAKFKTNHQDNQFNTLANKMLTIPLREINRQHKEGYSEKSKKSLIATSGPSIMNADKSAPMIKKDNTNVHSTNSRPDIIHQYGINQYGMNMPIANQANIDTPPTTAALYQNEYSQDARQNTPYYSSATWYPSSDTIGYINKASTTEIKQRASFTEQANKTPSETQKSIFDADPFENTKRNTITRVTEKLALLRKRKSVNNSTTSDSNASKNKKSKNKKNSTMQFEAKSTIANGVHARGSLKNSSSDMGERKNKIQTNSTHDEPSQQVRAGAVHTKPAKKWFTIDPSLMSANSKFMETKNLKSVKNNLTKRQMRLNNKSITGSSSAKSYLTHKRQNFTTVTAETLKKAHIKNTTLSRIAMKRNQTKQNFLPKLETVFHMRRSKFKQQQQKVLNVKTTKNITIENKLANVAAKRFDVVSKSNDTTVQKKSWTIATRPSKKSSIEFSKSAKTLGRQVQTLLNTRHYQLSKKSSIEFPQDTTLENTGKNSVNAWSLNSSFVDTLNKDFASSGKKSTTTKILAKASTKKSTLSKKDVHLIKGTLMKGSSSRKSMQTIPYTRKRGFSKTTVDATTASTKTKSRFSKQQLASRKSLITHHHKQPKLKHKEKKRKVIEKEHENLTKGIMDKALNTNHTQPTEAASQAQIVPPVDRLLGNNTILSEPLFNETNTTLSNMSSLRHDTIEAYALSPLKEETGSSRSSIVLGELAFNSALEKPKVLVFNDEAMGEKTRSTDFGVNDVEESLMKSMEVNNDNDDGGSINNIDKKKKKKSEIAQVNEDFMRAKKSEIANVGKPTKSNENFVIQKKSGIAATTKNDSTGFTKKSDTATVTIPIKNNTGLVIAMKSKLMKTTPVKKSETKNSKISKNRGKMTGLK